FTGAGMSGWTAMLAMLVAGVPLYVCATASTPIAAAMMAKGLEPGAALVFLLAGPATNVATMLVVKNLLGKRTLVLYLLSIALMSLAIGSLVNRLYPMFGLDPTAMDVDPAGMEHGPIATASGILLGVLLAHSAWRLRLDRRFGAWLRKVGRPVGLDLTALPIKLTAGALVVMAYGSTAVTTAAPGEAVFVEQFGRIAASRSTPGPLFHAPWPVSRARRVSTTRVRAIEFGVERIDLDDSSTEAIALKEAREELKRVRAESEMVTGEGWLVSVAYAVHYRVSDPETWLYGQSEPEELLRRLAQEAIRQVAATRTAEMILVGSSDTLRSETELRLGEAIERSGVGAALVGVELLSVHAPPAVHQQYRNVASALVDRETARIEAESRAFERVSEARTTAAEVLQRANSQREQAVALQTATAKAFEALAEVDLAYEGVVQRLMTLSAEKQAFEIPPGPNPPKRVFVGSPNVVIKRLPETNSRSGSMDEMRSRMIGGEDR
ncbi:MAG: SPFH domain-containing protein, partial [Planctomycetota bacterium]